MEGPHVRIEYQLTFEEYVEASRLLVRIRMWAVTLLFAGLAVLLILPPLPPSWGSGMGELSPLVIWLFIFGVISFLVLRTMRASSAKPWRRATRRPRRRMPAWASRFLIPTMALLAIIWAMVFRVNYEIGAARSAAVQTSASVNSVAVALSTIVSLLPMTLWAIVAALAGILSAKGGLFGWPYSGGWKSQYHLRRPVTAEFNDDFCIVSEPMSRHEYRWEFFPGWAETKKLFVLFVSNRAIQIFPKRAFADDAQRAVFTNLLEQKVSESLAAFQVMPLNSTSSPASLGSSSRTGTN